MITVYGHPLSTCTRKVLTTLLENGTSYEFVLVDLMKGEHKQPAHLARQPFGQVPAVDDSGFMLFESRAICRYLNETAGGKLVPADARGRAIMEQWISVEVSNFTPHAMKFVYHHVFQRAQEPAVLQAAEAKLTEALGIMDAQLAKQPAFAGADFSLADISFMPYVDYVMMTPAKELLAKWPHVMAWWGRVSERASWKKVAHKA